MSLFSILSLLEAISAEARHSDVVLPALFPTLLPYVHCADVSPYVHCADVSFMCTVLTSPLMCTVLMCPWLTCSSCVLC